MADEAPSGPSRGTAASRARRKTRRRSIFSRDAGPAASGRTPPRRRSLQFGTGGRAAMAREEKVVELGSGNLEWPESLPGVGSDIQIYLDPCGQPVEANLPLDVAEDVGCAAASNLFGGMPEQGKEPTLDELIDIQVDVIHVFARRQPGGDLRGRGGLGFEDMGRADAVVPERARGGDGPGDVDDWVQAYTESGFWDDDEYTIDCFPRQVFFVISLIVLAIALLILSMVQYIRS